MSEYIAADGLRAILGKEKELQPAMDADARKKLYSGWKNAVIRTFDWLELSVMWRRRFAKQIAWGQRRSFQASVPGYYYHGAWKVEPDK